MSTPTLPRRILFALSLLAAGGAVAGKVPARAGAKAGVPAAGALPVRVASVEGISEYRLPNGLRVLLFPDASKASVTVNVTYFVGSRHEGYGESGMAHLLEHMLFKGTPTHPKLWAELQDHGAQFNGTTWTDRTNYYETLPAVPGNLEWAIAMEADRMVRSKIAGEDLATEFSVVRNEFEMGENNPEEVLEERLFSSAYVWHGYGRSTIGSRSDIERVPVDNLRAFYQRFYQPDNAMLVVAGKFDPSEALGMVARHFGPLATPARKLPNTYTVEPVQDGERSVVLRRSGDVAVAGVVYHGVAGADPEFVAQEALVHLLTEKPSGRLYKALVEPGLAASVDGDAYTWAEPGVLKVMARVSMTRSDQSPERVMAKLLEIIESIGRGPNPAAPITIEEVKRFQTAEQKRFELAMTRSDRIGVQLSEWAAIGDWRMLFLHRDRVRALKPADVQAFAGKYLKSANRTSGLFLPTKAPERSPLPRLPDVAAMVKDYQGEQGADEGEAFEATIDNLDKRTRVVTVPPGLKLAMLEKRTRGHAVKLLLTVRFGSEADLKGRSAAARMVAAMLQRGTAKHTAQQLRDELDRLRAELQVAGDDGQGEADAARIRVTTVRESLPAVVDLIGEMLRQPSFLPSEFEVVRRDSLVKLEQSLLDPQVLAFTALQRRYQPFAADDARYVPTVAERIERVRALKVDEVQRVWRELWGAGATTLVAVGDFDGAALQAQLGRVMGDWKAQRPWVRVPQKFFAAAPAEEEILTPDKEMALVAAAHSVELREDDPAFPALMLSNFVLGASARSRLLARLREKEGLSYGAFSFVQADPFERAGMIFAGAICAPQNAAKAAAALFDEMKSIASGGIPGKELGESKAAWRLSYDNRLAQDDIILGIIDRNLFAGRGFEFQRRMVERIAALTPDEVGAALKKFIDPTRLSRVRAGDWKKAAAQ